MKKGQATHYQKPKVTDPVVTVTFSLKKSLLEVIEREAMKRGMAKSWIIADCVRRGLKERGVNV